MSLSTHVLDTTTGRPAAGVSVSLWHETAPGTAERLHEGVTDADGRIGGWQVGTGTHRLVFATGEWWHRRGTPAFHPEVSVSFTVTDPASHHHVPLLLSPFAYTTYRGS